MDTTPTQNPAICEEIDSIIPLYRDLFFNPKNHIAKQCLDSTKTPAKWVYLPRRIDGDVDAVLRSHLLGIETIGFYAHSLQNTCKWLCVDIDITFGIPSERIDRANECLGIVKRTVLAMGIPEQSLLMDFSGRKGSHLWVMLKETPMAEVQNFIKHLSNRCPLLPWETDCDLFPYPTTDPAKSPFGHQVKVPCGLHQASETYSYFLNAVFEPLADVRSHLEQVIPCVLPELPLIEEWTRMRKSRRPPKGKPSKREKAPKQEMSHIVLPAIDQPALTQEIGRLFRECAFLKNFRARPDLATHREWTHAGMVLASMGQVGADWFRHLSSIDHARFDPQHENIIQAVSQNGYKAPSCRTIDCSLCPVKCPLDHLGVSKKQYRTRLVDSPRSTEGNQINVAEVGTAYRAELKALLGKGSTGYYLVNLPLGAGKTTRTIESIIQENKRSLFYCPTHALAKEVEAKFENTQTILGLDRMEESVEGFKCPHKNEIYASVKQGLSSSYFCGMKNGICPNRFTCPYLQQFDSAQNADAVVLVHNHLELGEGRREKLLEGRNVVVVDESFVSQYRTEKTFGLDDIRTLLDLPQNVVAGGTLGVELRKLREAALGSILINDLDLYPKQFHKVDKFFRHKLMNRRNILRILDRCGKERIPIQRVSQDTFTVNLPVVLPNDKTVLILDATATAHDYGLLLDRPITVINPASGKILERHARTIQVVTGGYSNSSLLSYGKLSATGDRIVEFIRSRISESTDGGIICTKQMRTYLEENRVFPGLQYMHFNALRGLNSFSTIKDLFIIGYQGLSYRDLARQARIKFGESWDDDMQAEELKNQKEFLPLKMTGNLECEVHTLAPSNPKVLSYYRMTVMGEVEQAVGRARIFTNCGKEGRNVWLITNIPTGVEIDEVMELPGENKPDPIVKAAEALLAENGEFDRKTLACLAVVSDRHIRTMIERLVAELDLEITTGRHNKRVYRRKIQENLEPQAEVAA